MTTPPPRHPPELTRDAKDVLAAYRHAAPGAERRQANLEAVLSRVEEDAPPRAAAAAGLLWPVGWGVASAVAAAGLVWGVVTVRAPEPSPPPVVEEGPAAVTEPPAAPPSPPVRPVPQAPVEPVLQPAIQTPTKRVEPKPVAADAVDVGRKTDLGEETRLLRQVRGSIAQEAYDAAARQLEAYTLAFPDGALREDAQAYRVIVACKRGRSASALRSAFARRYPGSPHTARIAAACEGEKE